MVACISYLTAGFENIIDHVSSQILVSKKPEDESENFRSVLMSVALSS